MSLHLITQRGQPYGSTRRCCEECGLSAQVINDSIGEAATDDDKQYTDSPLNCTRCNLSCESGRRERSPHTR
jgi:hypothetical protein